MQDGRFDVSRAFSGEVHSCSRVRHWLSVELRRVGDLNRFGWERCEAAGVIEGTIDEHTQLPNIDCTVNGTHVDCEN